MGRRKTTEGPKGAAVVVPPIGDDQLQLALEAAQLLSWDWDLESGTIHWAGALPGVDLPTSIPSPAEAPFPLVWPGDREKLRCAALQCLETHAPTHAEFRVQSPTGVRWVAAVGRAYRNAEGRTTRILGVLREVTERIRIEEALREQRETLQVILDSVPALIWFKDADNRILRANRLAAESMSVPPAVIEGASTYELYPQEAESYHRDDREVIESGRPKLGIVEPLTLASGEKRWVRTDKVPYRNSAGDIVGVIVFSVDITERVNAEQALKRAHDDLERRVEMRTRDLQRAVEALRTEIAERRRAEERMRQHQADLAHLLRLHTVEGMAAQLAHEMNQPLSAIINFSSGLTRHLAGGNATREALEKVSQDIRREAIRAAAVVQRLRDFVRKEPPRRELCDLVEIIRDAMGLIEADTKREGITYRLDVEEPSILVLVDRIQIEQVVLNLMHNAVHAIDQAGAGPHEIAIQVTPGPDGVAVRVRDTGVGLPAGEVKQLFEPFFTTRRKGLGMGLSISRSIVEAHGGELTAEANRDRGASFVLTLPLRR
jgi:PAS domain S-box-containing protein